MFGLIVGTLCLFALIATVRARRYGYYAHGRFGHFRHAHGYGPHDYGYYHYGARRGRRRMALRWLFEQLDTTPGQEKAVVKSLEAWQEQVAQGRGELGDARKELAQALGGDVLDQSALESALGRVDSLVGRARAEFSASLQEVHAALDGKQRKLLAELIADFPSYRLGYGRC